MKAQVTLLVAFSTSTGKARGVSYTCSGFFAQFGIEP